jgi:hypothetical protein
MGADLLDGSTLVALPIDGLRGESSGRGVNRIPRGRDPLYAMLHRDPCEELVVGTKI